MQTEPKYIVYKPSGGLVHMLLGLTYIIKNRGSRKLIIDTCNHDAFRLPFDEFFNLKGVEFANSYDNLPGFEFLDQWDFSKFKKGEIFSDKQIAVYSGNAGKYYDIIEYVRVNQSIKDQFKKIDGKYIGVHFRNTDIKSDINKFIAKIRKYPYKKVYIATDDVKALMKFKKKLKNKEVISYAHLPDLKKYKNLHYLTDKQLGIDKKQQIIEALQDIYILTNATVFIRSKHSGFSKLVYKMRELDESIFD